MKCPCSEAKNGEFCKFCLLQQTGDCQPLEEGEHPITIIQPEELPVLNGGW